MYTSFTNLGTCAFRVDDIDVKHAVEGALLTVADFFHANSDVAGLFGIDFMG